MRKLVAAILLSGLCLLARGAAAQINCSALPYTFSNGTVIDANQFNANFAAIEACLAGANALPHVASNAALTASATTTFSNGVVRDDYALGNGAPPLTYLPAPGACASINYPGTSTPVVADNGYCVSASDGGHWLAQLPGWADWREFGANLASTDNGSFARAAAAAAWYLSLPLKFCGPGKYTVATTSYYYGGMTAEWCPGTVLKAANTLTGAVLAPATVPGDTYPTGASVGTLYNVRMIRPTIDQNLSAGAGLLVEAVVNGKIEQPNITNIPDTGKFNWPTQGGTANLPKGGLVMTGGNVNNVQNVEVDGGIIGNAITTGPPFDYSNCVNFGGAGIVLTAPQSSDANFGNPPNGNIFRNITFQCNRINVQNDYGSDNQFDDLDVSFAYNAGITDGTYGRYDLAVGGTDTNGLTLGVKFVSPTLSGGPIITVSVTTTGTLSTDVAALASAITANVALAAYNGGITASSALNSTGTYTLTISYAESATYPLGFDTVIPAGMTMAAAHGASRNYFHKIQAEGIKASGRPYVIGPNASKIVIDEYGSNASASNAPIGDWHPGPAGSFLPVLRDLNYGSLPIGTSVTSATYSADCVNDLQPYQVGTNSNAINITLAGYMPQGTICTFVDWGGAFATHNLTITASNNWFASNTIEGAASQTFSTNYQTIRLQLYGSQWLPIP